MNIRQATMILTILAAAGHTTGAQAQHCHREGVDVTWMFTTAGVTRPARAV